MKIFAIIFLAATLLAAGCASDRSPYDHFENWLIREDPTPASMVYADLIYLPNDLYVDMKNLQNVKMYTRVAVGAGKFGGIARVYSPLVATPEDLEKALEWYFTKQHEENRPFVFVGEGAGGGLLKAYEEEHRDELREIGFAASYYAEKPNADFVTDEMVKDIRAVFMRVKYRREWGREMPEGMLKK